MPDTLNKQAIINLLIDSPLREPIKINLIDIVNNTSEPDLPKVYSTITKELEIFQKATERRMKLAEETIAKLGGSTPTPVSTPTVPQEPTSTPAPVMPAPVVMPTVDTTPTPMPDAGLSVPPLDLPPMPVTAPTPSPVIPTVAEESPAPMPSTPNFQPLGAAPMSSTSDEDALAEIQKELDSLKTEAAADIATAANPTPAAPATPPLT